MSSCMTFSCEIYHNHVYVMMHCSSHHTLTMPLWMKFVRPHMRRKGAWAINCQSFQGVVRHWLKFGCDKNMKHIGHGLM